MRVVVIGGVAGGMSAATRLRRLDEHAEIVVFERGDYVSFANCGLPYHVGGVIEERDALLLQTPESLRSRFELDVRTRHEVIGIDAAAQTVRVRDLRDGSETTHAYDRLIIAAGAQASEVFDQHIDGPTVATLRTIDDLDRVNAALADGPARVVVAGGGFIGLEAAENLVLAGHDVTLVQRGRHPLSPLDTEMAAAVIDELHTHSVQVRTGTTVRMLDADGTHLDDGTVIGCRLVVDARGVRPASALAREAGLRIGPTGGIEVSGHAPIESLE